MDRLEQIKNEVSMDFHLKETDWRELSGEIARRYATEVAMHNLERAANQAQMSYHDGHHKTNSRIKYFQSGADHLVVDMESITSLEIELI